VKRKNGVYGQAIDSRSYDAGEGHVRHGSGASMRAGQDKKNSEKNKNVSACSNNIVYGGYQEKDISVCQAAEV